MIELSGRLDEVWEPETFEVWDLVKFHAAPECPLYGPAAQAADGRTGVVVRVDRINGLPGHPYLVEFDTAIWPEGKYPEGDRMAWCAAIELELVRRGNPRCG